MSDIPVAEPAGHSANNGVTHPGTNPAVATIATLLQGLRGPAPDPDDLWRLQSAIGAVAPSVPTWAVRLIGNTLANRQASADGFLVLADALRDAAHFAGHSEGGAEIGRQLRRLADIAGVLAPMLHYSFPEVPPCP